MANDTKIPGGLSKSYYVIFPFKSMYVFKFTNSVFSTNKQKFKKQ